MSDLDFIKKFAKITVSGVCKELGIQASNMYAGRVSDEKVAKVRKYLMAKVGEVLIEDFVSNEQQEDN